MNPVLPRRSFIRSAATAGALAGLGDLGFLGGLPSISAAEAKPDPRAVQFTPEIEPLVRLLEDTPRARLLEEVGARIKRGTTYREVLAALLLAGVRNIQPRPVGFKFHAVLVVNSAHLASQNSPAADRWLPIFWALDQFKNSQARDVREGDWTLAAVDEAALPAPERAGAAFTAAMDRWDPAATDTATAALVRTAPPAEIFDLLCRYGARDYRDLGHKAIYVANSWRTLQTIGWQHAEPVLRSLAYAMLDHEGGNPAERDAEADRPARRHRELLVKIPAGWQDGNADARANADATTVMLRTLREGSWENAGDAVIALLNRGVAPASLWDAIFSGAGELLMRKPGIATLHAVTATNALHYAFQHATRDETRRLLLLQGAAFIPLFRATAGVNPRQGVAIDEFEAVAPAATGADAVAEIFADVSRDKLLAARKTLGWLAGTAGAQPFIAAAQRMIYLKGTDSHDYKFSSAAIEDYRHLSPRVRDRFLAASVFWLKGSGAADNALVARSRAAL
ncbi:MAG: hypothetical protein Q8N18_14460 [Opitutaceae bacterium]|nr:hypothetical protein [Opitutaceae bacterium]